MKLLVIGEEHIREKVARHYATLCAEHGFTADFYADNRSGISVDTSAYPQVEVHPAPDPTRGVGAILRYWGEYRKCFDEVAPDVLEVQTSIHFLLTLPMMAYAQLRGVPSVVVCRGELYPTTYNGMTRLRRLLFHWTLRTASLIIYKEPYMDEILERIAPRTTRLFWGNAIPVRDVEPSFERTENRVLYLNFLRRVRNVDLIIRSAERVRKAVPDVQFEIVGGTEELAGASDFYADLYEHEKELRTLIAARGLGDFVRIHPFVSQVDDYFARAKVYLLPADVVFCNYALLEAMERGVPPIASDEKDKDARRIVEHGVNGLLVPLNEDRLADAVISLLTDEERRQELGKAARETIRRRFNLRRQTDALVQQYRMLAGTEAGVLPVKSGLDGTVDA